jgi:hypothetical protein
MRRRYKALLTSGAIGSLRSEGRLLACYVFLYADFTTCRLRVSVRGAARTMAVRPTTVRRGLQQLVEASILAVAERGTTLSRTIYEVLPPPRQDGHEPCPARTRVVTTMNTSRVRSVHERCASRTRAVSKVDTSGDPLQVITIGIPSNTNGGITDSPPGLAGASQPGQPGEPGA